MILVVAKYYKALKCFKEIIIDLASWIAVCVEIKLMVIEIVLFSSHLYFEGISTLRIRSLFCFFMFG